ncbi:MAG: glycosyltransferase [Candidatus Omnitrophota bacterium]|nr:glycosyltransferase [Candidatus Omnitrophota bacterium]
MVQAKKPRILYMLGWFYPDSVGGSEYYVYLLAKEVQASGWEVMIAAPSVDEKEDNYAYEGLSVYRYPVSLKPTRLEVRGETLPKYFDVFANWLKNYKPDIVHMHSYTRGCGFFHAQFVKQLRISLIFTVHIPGLTCVRGTLMRWGKIPCDGQMRLYRCGACYLEKQGLSKYAALAISAISTFTVKLSNNPENRLGTALGIKRLVSIRKERIQQLFNLADGIVLVSKWLYGVFRINGIPDAKLSLCRHGLPPELINSRPRFDTKVSKPIRIGYLGRFDPFKGVHVLVEAIKRLPLDIPIELRLYGRVNDEEGQAYLKKLQKTGNHDSRILFCGEVTDKDYPEIFNNLDILAVPSLWLETGPLVVLEAFAAGIPVMGSNLGGISELVTNGVNGILLEPGSIKAWSNAIQQLCLYPESLKDWVRGIPPVRSNSEVVGQMLKLYENFVG